MQESEIKTIDELIKFLNEVKKLDNINGEAELYIEAHEEACGTQVEGIVVSYDQDTHTITFEPNMKFGG